MVETKSATLLPADRRINSAPRHLLYLALIIGVAFALRVIKLNSLPFSLNLDEAINGLDALQLLRLTWLTPFLQNNFGRETLFFYGQGLALQLYGISFFSLRFASALSGTLTIPLLYLVGQRLRLDNLLSHKKGKVWWLKYISPPLRERLDMAGLLAATGLAVSYWHVYFSRLGLRAILLPPLLLGLVWCFWQGWDDQKGQGRRRFWLVIAGFLLGLTFYTYLAARLLPVLFIIFVAIELIKPQPNRKEKAVDFFIFGLVATLTGVPLVFYFQQNPQAFGSRTQTISIFAGNAPLDTLGGNLTSLLQIHFFGGAWLGEWPALNLLSALGLLLGLLVCLHHLKKPAIRFLLLWWGIGTAPVLFSSQDWTGQTTLLRGIMAWPALFLISAIGLVTLANLFHKITKRGFVFFWLLLIVGSLTTIYHYFFIWATTYNRFSDHPPYLARYLNSQTSQFSLTPLRFYAETVTNFLLQARYPTLTNIEAGQLQALLESNRATVYLLPAKSTAEATFVLLVPAADGQGTAYLLPPLTPAQIETLSHYTGTSSPLTTVLDSEQEPIAHVYPLPADAPFLPVSSPAQVEMHPIQANFNHDLVLTGYRVEPATIKPGETVTLSFHWQAQRPIDGDYYLFVHLFDVQQGQRHGQVNTPLTGILFDAHRWPVGLTVPDRHSFTLPADAPAGAYRFEVGLYHASSQQRLPVTVGATQPTPPTADKVILGKFHVWQHPPPPPQYPLTNIQFDDNIALIGVDLPTAPLQPGQTLTYTLHWQALAPISQNYTVFTHLLDAENNLQTQQDNAPQQGRYPTSWWDAGEIIIDPYALPLPPYLTPGRYTLRVGLYRPETGQRLPLKNEQQDFVDFPNSITIENR